MNKSKTSSRHREDSPSKGKSSSSSSSRHRRSKSPRSKRSPSPRRYSSSGSHRNESSSHRRRSKSPDPIDKFLERTNRRRSKSPYDPFARHSRSRSRSPAYVVQSKRKENELFREKLTLTAEGRWNADLESKWKAMEKEEELLSKQFKDYRKQLEEKPEDHKKYAGEWAEYWAKESKKVKESGKDADTYDYIPGWKAFWSKKLELLIDVEYSSACEAMRRKYGMDLESLRKLSNNSGSYIEEKPSEPFFNVQGQPGIISTQTAMMPPTEPATRISRKSDEGGIRVANNTSRVEDNSIPKSPVTVNDVKSTWESLTGQPFRANPFQNQRIPVSEAEPAKEQAKDFDGFNLVQVLQMISGLEDQLSFLSSKVQDFLNEADELEKLNSRNSYNLLDNEEFVSLLLQCRDRFTSLIRANVLPKETLKTLNLSVYLLNLVLSSPQSLKSLARLEELKLKSKAADLSLDQKREIVNLIAANLLAKGRQTCELNLDQFIFDLLKTIAKGTEDPSSTQASRVAKGMPEPSFPPLTPRDNMPPERVNIRGTALPPYPKLQARAASPPFRPGLIYYQQIKDPQSQAQLITKSNFNNQL